MAMVEQLRNELIRPIVVDGFPLSVGVSIGLAFVPTHGRTPEDLLSAADVAMYRAKRYRTGVESYKALGSRPERGRLGLLGELSNAISSDQLKVHYQPLTRFSDGAPEAMEALLRWQHPTLGQVPPNDFITLAEHTDLIGPLTQFVLSQATIDACVVDRFDMRLSINVSARNLQDRRFPSSVLKALDEAALDTSRLELEITESAIASEPERSLFAISALREAGVRVAIDDFGTGYSSFSMLRDLTVDRLKIDASFVDGIAHSQRQQHLVKAIVALARGLGIETVAEGVETEESWITLANSGLRCGPGLPHLPAAAAARPRRLARSPPILVSAGAGVVMIIVVASIIAILTVPMTGRSLAPLATLPVRRVGLVWLAIGLQVIITVVPGFPNWLGQPLHLFTFVLAAAFIWSNRYLPGVLFIAFGAALNLAAIAANRGTMPASAWAWRTAGFATQASGFENSNVVHGAHLPWLGDVFAIPRAWPLSNVFSVGDVIVVVAIGYFVHTWCRRAVPADTDESAGAVALATSD